MHDEHITSTDESSSWTFLSNHAHVLICLARDPTARLRDVADRVGITERAVQKIVSDLVDGGILSRKREGRRNHYQLHASQPLRHPLEAHKTVEALLSMVLESNMLLPRIHDWDEKNVVTPLDREAARR